MTSAKEFGRMASKVSNVNPHFGIICTNSDERMRNIYVSKVRFFLIVTKFKRGLCKFSVLGTLGVQAYCVPLITSKPYILPDHSRPVQVVIDPKIHSNTFNSEVKDKNTLKTLKEFHGILNLF